MPSGFVEGYAEDASRQLVVEKVCCLIEKLGQLLEVTAQRRRTICRRGIRPGDVGRDVGGREREPGVGVRLAELDEPEALPPDELHRSSQVSARAGREPVHVDAGELGPKGAELGDPAADRIGAGISQDTVVLVGAGEARGVRMCGERVSHRAVGERDDAGGWVGHGGAAV